MAVSSKLPVGTALLFAGLLIALFGSFADNVLGGGGLVLALQLLLWVTGGVIVLAGATSTVTLRTGQRAGQRGLRPVA
ncbi:MAG: hypothetical protein H0V81_12905 [Solirubrobacterales bacterium]|nr:hypothetical protein [Solirubrobacterales bacterium]